MATKIRLFHHVLADPLINDPNIVNGIRDGLESDMNSFLVGLPSNAQPQVTVNAVSVGKYGTAMVYFGLIIYS